MIMFTEVDSVAGFEKPSEQLLRKITVKKISSSFI